MPFSLVPVTPFEQNCTLLWCEHARELALVDPGGDLAHIAAAVEETGCRPTKVLLTHGHLDHVGAARLAADRWQIPIVGPHREDAFLLQSLPQQAQMFGFPEIEPFAPDTWLNHGDRVALGERELEVLHLPGHTPGHVAFYDRDDGYIQVGDVLFAGSIGRTDFPRGNHAELIRSIKERLFPLGDEVRFIPGHGPTSTLGRERRSNPFVGGA